MRSPRSKPSITSLVAFILIVSPVAYVLSYAPVVRACGRTVEVPRRVEPAIYCGTFSQGVNLWFLADHVECADSSVYPAFQPVDWLIDETGLREPLLSWAGMWGVREPFEVGYRHRHDLTIESEPAIRIWDIAGQK